LALFVVRVRLLPPLKLLVQPLALFALLFRVLLSESLGSRGHLPCLRALVKVASWLVEHWLAMILTYLTSGKLHLYLPGLVLLVGHLVLVADDWPLDLV
jgi:hypothetical protein